jgi:hypothetical protein
VFSCTFYDGNENNKVELLDASNTGNQEFLDKIASLKEIIISIMRKYHTAETHSW